MAKMEVAKNDSLEDDEQNSDDIETSKALDEQIEKYIPEEDTSTTPAKKKRGRPKKTETKDFVEPSQSDIDNSQEFNPPI